MPCSGAERRKEHFVISFAGSWDLILHGLIMSLFPKLFNPRHLHLLSTPSPPSRLFKLDDDSFCAIVINSALWSGWLSFARRSILVPLQVLTDVDIECVQDSQPLKIGLLCLYTDVFLEGKQTHYQKSVISIPWRQPIEQIKQLCQTLSLRGITCVPFLTVCVCVYRQSCRSVVQCERRSA